MTNAEWAAIALLCKSRGFMPRGNNNYGQDTDVASEKGIPSYWYDSSGTKYIGRTLTGSGPLGWVSDGSPFGVADLNGNIYEWTPGLRLNNGEIQILPDNDAADNSKDLSATSVLWRAMLQDGTLVYTKWVTDTAYALNAYITVGGKVYKATTAGTSGTPEPTWPANVNNTVTDGSNLVWTCVSDATLKYDFVAAPANSGTIQINTTTQANPSDYYGTTTLETLAAAGGVTVPNLMKLLGLAPIDANHGGDRIYMDSLNEKCAVRGGSWGFGSEAGVFSLDLDGPRSGSYVRTGFRSAFVL
jgi:hypothetical protein